MSESKAMAQMVQADRKIIREACMLLEQALPLLKRDAKGNAMYVKISKWLKEGILEAP